MGRASQPAGGPADRVAILIVVVAGVLTASFVASRVMVGDPRPVAMPEVLRITAGQPQRVAAGAQPGTGAAPACTPALDARFEPLARRLGDVMGAAQECAHPNSDNRDVVQRTSRGLAVYRAQSGRPVFTNGSEHWAFDYTTDRLLFWTGSSVDPPRDALRLQEGQVRPQAAEAAEAGRPAGDVAHVAHTDGAGVVLRASPRDQDWTPRGFMDGAAVTILERQGNDWARVRGANGQEGWVPTRYLAN
jgi:hypothetical protein